MLPNLTTRNNRRSNEEARTTIYGCSKLSSFIPLWALYKIGQTDFFKNTNGNTEMLWHHRHPKNRRNPMGNKYEYLYNAYRNHIFPSYWENKQKGYYIRKGMITTTDFEILIAVCVDSKSWNKIDINNPDLNKFVMIVNRKLYTNPFNKLLRNKIKKDILEKLSIDIIETDDPNKYCFKIPDFIPKFKNFQMMKEYLDNVNDKLCLKERKEEKLIELH